MATEPDTRMMRSEATDLPGVLLIEPPAFADQRGVFFETWERERYAALGLPAEWVQDNVVHSTRGVLRGMHFQTPDGQHKLISVIVGRIFDVVVDVRRGSPTFARWTGHVLSAENRLQLSVPVGFAHGYLVLSETSIVSYKCSTRYNPRTERALRWDDADVSISWPAVPLLISDKDRAARGLKEFADDELPVL